MEPNDHTAQDEQEWELADEELDRAVMGKACGGNCVHWPVHCFAA
jgi:hypothetical protein